MDTDNRLTNTAIIISILLLIGIALLSFSKLPITLPGIIILALIIGIISFINTDIALIILIFSMLLSPEFGAGGIPGREVVIRVDDIFLILIFFGWLTKMAVNKELGLLRYNPLNMPIIIYIFIIFLATLLGSLQGHVNMKSGIFFIFKYSEYFLLFFLVVNNLKGIRQIKIFIFLLLSTSFIVSAYAWYLKLSGYSRVAAPFDVSQGSGEPNTLAGYLLLMMALIIGLIIYSKSINQRIALSGLLCFMVPPFLFTLSRGTWLAFFPMFITMIVLAKKARFILILSLLIIIVLLPIVAPQSVKERVDVTFESGKTYTVFGKELTIAESGAARIDTWIRVINKWSKHPVLGYGVTGAGFIDAQYPRVLGETGLIGFLAFLWIIATIFKEGLKNFNFVEDEWAKGLTLGFLAGFMGLLFQGISVSTFIIVRIMEPFWFLTAIVIMLPEMNLSPEKQGEDIS